ncbi:unnamed protein product [Clavelina lepadiformis]|uniref:Sema domain-containing protein n=1 Tax=Clavelina lepadiformis TaxID=159417 RepID=A0ABP0EUJ5_CLALP
MESTLSGIPVTPFITTLGSYLMTGTTCVVSIERQKAKFTTKFVQNLFVFTEISVEDKSEQVYTRIGQVCKHDGGWRNLRNQFSSFFKARLNCSLPGQPPFYFNELSDVTELVTLDKLYKVGKTKTVFALMNTPSNSIPASAICAFSLPDIEASRNGAFYEKFADAKTSAQYWAQQDNYSEPHLASCASDPSKLSVRSLNFMRMHPVMYQSVNAWDLHSNVTQPHNAIPLYSRTNSGF